MKLIDIDDCGDSYNTMASEWTTVGQGSLVSTTVRTGLWALGFVGTTACKKQVAAANEHATFEIGFGSYRNGTPNTTCVFYSDSGATTHITLVIGTNLIEVRRGTTSGSIITQAVTGLTASYVGTVASSLWNHIELKITLHDTLGVVQVWLNGTLIISLVGDATNTVDTKNSGTKTVLDSYGFSITSGSGGNNFVDDVFLLNGATDTPDITSPLGDRRVLTLYPNADGTNKALTGVGTVVGTGAGTYQNVDDGATPNDTDYNEGATGLDTYGFQDATIVDSTAIVDGVMFVHRSAKSDVGTKYFKPTLRAAGTNYQLAGQGLAAAFAYYKSLYRRSPDATNWSVAKVNALEAGVEASDTP